MKRWIKFKKTSAARKTAQSRSGIKIHCSICYASIPNAENASSKYSQARNGLSSIAMIVAHKTKRRSEIFWSPSKHASLFLISQKDQRKKLMDHLLFVLHILRNKLFSIVLNAMSMAALVVLMPTSITNLETFLK